MKKFGLIGYPLGHSMSAKHFSAKFANENIDARYDLYPLENIEQFASLKSSVPDLCGLNVTLPYKEGIIPYLDELDQTAARVGAVNVIKFIRHSGATILRGYNTDALGFEQSLVPLLKSYHRKALILGTGGAAKAVKYALEKRKIETCYVSRTK
ncbi:MAG: shikimate dehydrogenase, partial [Paludibacter sp.]|nr:shikimate dehydrogenase [Paludibacter sp.]